VGLWVLMPGKTAAASQPRDQMHQIETRTRSCE